MVSYGPSGRKETGAAGPVATGRRLVHDDACGRDADGQGRRGDGQGEYRYMTLLKWLRCTQVHGSCGQPGGRGLCPVYAAGHRSWRGSDSPVQVVCAGGSDARGCPWRGGRRGGSYSKATRYTDSGRSGVPSGRSGASAGVAWQQASASSWLRNLIASSLLRDQLDRPCHAPAGVNHVRAEPGCRRRKPKPSTFQCWPRDTPSIPDRPAR